MRRPDIVIVIEREDLGVQDPSSPFNGRKVLPVLYKSNEGDGAVHPRDYAELALVLNQAAVYGTLDTTLGELQKDVVRVVEPEDD